ncbi:MAG: immunoglobulin domain-containing protein, partial [Oscillospiraceae bacterium]
AVEITLEETNSINPIFFKKTLGLLVGSPPTITTQPTDQKSAAGTATNFTITATGAPDPAYQWEKWNDESKAWEKIDGATGSTYTIDPTTFAMNGDRVRCKVENVINGTTHAIVSNEAVLTVTSPPFIVTNPTDQAVVSPATASFTVKANGSKPLQYQWEFSVDNGSIWNNVTSGTGINSETYVTPVTATTMNGYLYRCLVSGSINPPAISQSAKLKVTDPPEIVIVLDEAGITNEFWIGVVTKIQAAKKGDVLKINTGRYTKMPACVMEELRIKGTGMIIKWNGGKSIVIPSGKAHNAEENREFWTFAELSELYKNYRFGKDPNKTSPETGVETGTEAYSYVDTKTGETTPVTGSIVDATPHGGKIASQIEKYTLVVMAGILVATVIIFSANAWMKKRKKEQE